MEEDKEKLICSLCEREVNRDDDFCTNCGTLFAEFVKCDDHADKEAKGVCVICCTSYCEECGVFADDRVFLCSEHSEYEIIEGMACVLGANDTMQTELVKSNFEQEGLHPFIFSRNANSIYSSVAYTGNKANLFQLMVTFQEVLRAEEILRDIELLE